MLSRFVAVALVLLPLGRSDAQSAPTKIALVGATVIDGTGAAPVPNATVLIEGSRIVAVGPRGAVAVPAGTTVIDVANKFVLPGFIDLHMHLTYSTDYPTYQLQTDAEATLRAFYYMELFQRLGITSVRDVAASVGPIKAAAAALGEGLPERDPRLRCRQVDYLDGRSRGGRASLDLRRWAHRIPSRGPDDARPRFPAHQTLAVLHPRRGGGGRRRSQDPGDADHQSWRRRVGHLAHLDDQLAVAAGVQSIEHLNQMDDDALDLMAAKGVAIVPTIAIYRHLYRENQISREMVERRGWKVEMHETLFRKAHQRGIVLGVGSDAVFDMMKLYPDLYFEEMRYFVELGMTPMEAIVAATKNGGAIIGDEYQIGTLEAGKLADLQVLATNPLVSFAGLGKPEMVMIGGRIRRFK